MKKLIVKNTDGANFEIVSIEDVEGGEPVETSVFKYAVPEKVSLKSRQDALDFIESANGTIKELAKQWQVAKGDTQDTIFAHIVKLADRFNEASAYEATKDCWEHEKPLLWACTRMIYETMTARLKEDKKLDVITLEIKRRDRRIALDKLHKDCGGIGENTDWIYTAQAVNKIFTARLITELKGDKAADALTAIDNSYHMAEIAKAIDMGKNPVSNSKTLEQLRLCITQMIGAEYAPNLISFDVKFITTQYAKESKKDAYGLTLEAAAHKRFYDLLMRVCHHLITNKPYGVVFKEKK